MKVALLAGGTGGTKLAHGFAQLPEVELSVVANEGDGRALVPGAGELPFAAPVVDGAELVLDPAELHRVGSESGGRLETGNGLAVLAEEREQRSNRLVHAGLVGMPKGQR